MHDGVSQWRHNIFIYSSYTSRCCGSFGGQDDGSDDDHDHGHDHDHDHDHSDEEEVPATLGMRPQMQGPRFIMGPGGIPCIIGPGGVPVPIRAMRAAMMGLPASGGGRARMPPPPGVPLPQASSMPRPPVPPVAGQKRRIGETGTSGDMAGEQAGEKRTYLEKRKHT